VGVGNISGELFRLARAIGFGRLLGSDPYCSPERAAELGVELVDLETLMRESDFVSLHTPLTPETENLINAETLAWMKPTAFLINTSRGGVVDEDALFAALKSGSIAGAALDVLREEPPPRDHPLFKLDNVLLAPHSVAWVKEGLEGNSRELCTNIRSIYRGEAPPFLVNPDVLRTQAFQTRLVAWKS
jgi:phosphoglycerate dehydrogenase-like enzyme